MRKSKPLSPKQGKRVNRLVKKECCNFDNGNCILLDEGEACLCSLLCRWFSDAVLPLDRELFAELYAPEEKRRCTVCGAPFASKSNNAKYCPDCRKKITRKQAAERMQKKAKPCYEIEGANALHILVF